MSTDRPDIQCRKEIRFAVVMYGGVSLAVYMNGIAQELLRLVRSTAQKSDGTLLLRDDELTGTERVYRRLGQILGRDDAASPIPPSDAPVRTRFVVDVLSGTSAGGINAVFLAKALANGQEMAGLKELWVSEGDIEKLLNDAKGADWGRPAQKPPLSLLSSRRMYYKLVVAFDAMEAARIEPDGTRSNDHSRPESGSPYVRELDLYVTATDLDGLPIPLRLADEVITERRHRNVFHFAYASPEKQSPRNDFHAANNAFLAFASRCTSAFPFAFEPMRLADIDEVLQVIDRPWHRGISGRAPDHWREFFPDYRAPLDGTPIDFSARAFADGGYLDNKPFSYATDALSSRSAGIPVDRKLLYIEPNPDPIDTRTKAKLPPDAIENVMKAFTLARYETIRQDLQRIVARNRLVARVETLTRGLEEDVEFGTFGPYETRDEYARLFLDDMMGKDGMGKDGMGISYGGYHRLKVGAVTDHVARMVTCAAGLNPDSDEFLAIRHIVRAWRNLNFKRYRGEDDGRRSENAFLVEFDILYRLRRLNFLLLRIDRACAGGVSTQDMLERRGISVDDPEAFVAALTDLRARLLEPLQALRAADDRLVLRDAENPLRGTVDDLRKAADLRQDRLRNIIDGVTEDVCHDRALAVIKDASGAFEAVAADLAKAIGEVTVQASTDCRAMLAPGEEATPDQLAAVKLARFYYDNFERYDLITFPVYQTAGLGQEVDPVEVLRISPVDATALLSDADAARRKLAGTALMNFGAFLDRGWRKNDILWGHLDGAERIICSMVPDGELRHDLVKQAHQAILVEEFDLAKDELNEAMVAKLLERKAPEPPPFLASVKNDVIAGTSYEEALYETFSDRYVDSVDRTVDPEMAARTVARSTRVVGGMLEEIAEKHRVSSKPGAWVAKLGSIFWGLVELAAPNSLSNLLFRHWLKLIYLVEAFLILGGVVLVMPQVQNFGLIALALTLLAHLLTWGLGRWMTGRMATGAMRGVVSVAVALVVVLVMGLAVVGAFDVFNLVRGWFPGR